MIKYFLYAEGTTTGLKYDKKKEVLSFGGFNRFEPIVAQIAEVYLNINLMNEDSGKITRTQVQKNKFRYDIKISFDDFVDAVKKLRENYTLEETSTLYRIMR